MSIWSRHLPVKNEGLVGLQKEVNDFFETALRDQFRSSDFMPRIEVKEEEKSYHVSAEMAGLREEDIQLTLKDNCLIIEGEKKSELKREDKNVVRSEISYGSFVRTVPFLTEVNAEKVSATYRDGVLKVDIEKTRPEESRPRKITVKKS